MMRRRGVKMAAVLAVLIGLSYAASRVFPGNEQVLRDFFARIPRGPAAVLFIGLYVVSSFIIVDLKDLLKLAAALLFGAYWSAGLIWAAELINCWMLFALARRWGRAWVDRRCGLKGSDLGWVRKLCSAGALFVLRTVPAVPYRILDIAYGLTAVPFRKYFLISALASPVRIVWLQVILAALGGAVFNADQVAAYLLKHPAFVRLSLLYLAASLFGVFLVSRRMR